jgi:hypothetical protein
LKKQKKNTKKAEKGGGKRNIIPNLCQVPYTMVFLIHFEHACWWLWCHTGYRDRYLSVLFLDFGVEGDYLGHNTIMVAQAVPEHF